MDRWAFLDVLAEVPKDSPLYYIAVEQLKEAAMYLGLALILGVDNKFIERKQIIDLVEEIEAAAQGRNSSITGV